MATPNDTLNSGYTAIPKDISMAGDPSADLDLVSTAVDYGEMNEADARASGYIDESDRREPPRFDRERRKSSSGGWMRAALIGGSIGIITLFFLRRRGRRARLSETLSQPRHTDRADRDIPSWLTAEAMGPIKD